MIKDITIGQYYAGDSVLHRMDARMKLVLTLGYMVVIFLCKNFFALGLLALSVAVFVALSRVPLGMVLRSFRPIVVLVLFTSALNLFLTPGEGEPLWHWWKLQITTEGIHTAIFTTARILCLIAASSLLTYTTTPSLLTAGIERLLWPLGKLGVPVSVFAMMMTLALRFVPTLVEEIDRIMNAQKSRGANMDTGSLFQRIKAFVPVLVPLIVSAFRRAGELAYAMECRCYTGSNRRTSLKQFRLRARDYAAAALMLLLGGGIVTMNIFLGKII
ncbi:MAG: energy-coupling factor transporter transmembrane protein EcfT [Oscillospiraceae bacterium]|jgi:energy-coupling factor transport system permease protein|nr:energy-coupling factor transporter transmembrane protein EcfT [Oscillospiraceae bacterium]